jgi:hypothetical protein
LGAHRYGLGQDFANRTLEITFDAQTQELICWDHGLESLAKAGF